MVVILLIILILRFNVNVSYTRIIRISQKGRTIVLPADHGGQTIRRSSNQKISETNNESDNSQPSESQNEIVFRKKLNLKTTKIFSLPLNGML